MSDPGSVVDNTQTHRFELDVDGGTAFIDYVERGDALDFAHTEVPQELEGQGIGSALVRGALELARERGVDVIPSCPFVAAWVRRHPDYVNTIAEPYRQRLQRDR